jgi:hypothetical protein
MYREVWDSWRDVLERRMYSLQNHAQQLTHLPPDTPRHQGAWHRCSVLLLPLSSFLQSNEWTLLVEGVKLYLLQILRRKAISTRSHDFTNGVELLFEQVYYIMGTAPFRPFV